MMYVYIQKHDSIYYHSLVPYKPHMTMYFLRNCIVYIPKNLKDYNYTKIYSVYKTFGYL